MNIPENIPGISHNSPSLRNYTQFTNFVMDRLSLLIYLQTIMISIVRIIIRLIKNVYGVLSCTYRRGASSKELESLVQYLVKRHKGFRREWDILSNNRWRYGRGDLVFE